MDPELASYGISDYVFAITQLAQTTLRSEIGKIDLDRTFEERATINTQVVTELDKASEAWGVKVLRYEIKNINPPADVLAAMEKQMRAEREKRAVILTSEGERDAAINTAEGEKQQVIKASEASKQQQINEAEGQAAAILAVAKATAEGIRSVAGRSQARAAARRCSCGWPSSGSRSSASSRRAGRGPALAALAALQLGEGRGDAALVPAASCAWAPPTAWRRLSRPRSSSSARLPPAPAELREPVDKLDHVLFVFRQDGRWGSVARSRDPGLHGRKPVFRSPRQLAASYQDAYVDLTGRVTGYAVADLRELGSYDWRLSRGTCGRSSGGSSTTRTGPCPPRGALPAGARALPSASGPAFRTPRPAGVLRREGHLALRGGLRNRPRETSLERRALRDRP
jgi:hypothetical protein